jgi:hypothetical protein
MIPNPPKVIADLWLMIWGEIMIRKVMIVIT